jgi:hypothetical protein
MRTCYGSAGVMHPDGDLARFALNICIMLFYGHGIHTNVTTTGNAHPAVIHESSPMRPRLRYKKGKSP